MHIPKKAQQEFINDFITLRHLHVVQGKKQSQKHHKMFIVAVQLIDQNCLDSDDILPTEEPWDVVKSRKDTIITIRRKVNLQCIRLIKKLQLDELEF